MFAFLKKLFGFADVNNDGQVNTKDIAAVAETVKVAATKVENAANAAAKPVAKKAPATKKPPTKKKPAAKPKAPAKKPAAPKAAQ